MQEVFDEEKSYENVEALLNYIAPGANTQIIIKRMLDARVSRICVKHMH